MQKYSHTAQISRFSCCGIFIGITLYVQTLIIFINCGYGYFVGPTPAILARYLPIFSGVFYSSSAISGDDVYIVVRYILLAD